MNPKSLKNLKQQKGFTGNPGGRPKTSTFRAAAIEWLEAEPSRRTQIIQYLAENKPDFLVQLVDGKLVETSVKVDATGDQLENVIDALTRYKAKRQGVIAPTT